MKHLLPLIFLLFSLQVFAQPTEAPCRLRISLITCAPGEELYSIFGHTAIRVQDSSFGMDEVFNYGTFEFSDDFYVQFIRGKLLYYLSIEDYNDFLFTYKVESRSVWEQELVLDCEQKQDLYTALRINAMEENKFYRYDFLFDNCTTRAKDMIKNKSGSTVQLPDILQGKQLTFRNMIHSYLDAGNQHWSKLGIDILLGARLDRKVTNEEAMFLPEYLMRAMDKAKKAQGQPVVLPATTILELPSPLGKGFWITPMIAFSLVLLAAVFISFNRNSRSARWSLLFDRVLFTLTGLAGLLLLFMWFGTDHYVAASNYNLLWALPTNIVAVFFIHKESRRSRIYFLAVAGISLLLILSWFFLPQQMNPALLPLVATLLVRSYLRGKKN